MNIAKFGAVPPLAASESYHAERSSGELPSLPSTSVVTPWRTKLSAVGISKIAPREWVCGSMKPGATA